MKKSNDVSYETTEPILMKFHIKHLCDGYTRLAKKGEVLKFKMAVMPIYGKNHSDDSFSRTTRLIWPIFCMKLMGHFSTYNS